MSPDLVIEDLRGAIVGPASLAVRPGSCAAITGSSGAGKSLFLRMIADLVAGDGEVRLGSMRRASVAAPAWRRQVMYVAAEAGWWAPRIDAHVPPSLRAEANRLCERLGLAGYFDREIATLSTGEKQRLALMRALIRKPKALLLDEPTGALDAASIGLVESLLRETLAAGTILIVVSHDAAQAERLGATRFMMQAGRLSPA